MTSDRSGFEPASTPPVSRLGLIARQGGIVFLGFLLAAIMVGLGLWQLGVYNQQGEQQARARAAQPPVALESVARPGQQVTADAYARQVRFTGSYDQRLQTLVSAGSGNRYRVLTALRLPGGGILPVVRGMVTGHKAPPAPAGQITGTGILMPSEGTQSNGAGPSDQPTAVVLPSLAQQWNGLLINGFATLNPAESREQSLQPVTVALPSSHGRLRNGFYALQWWVFAAFAIWMGIRMARDWGRNPGGLMGSDSDPADGGVAPPEAAMSSNARSEEKDSAAQHSTT